MESSSVISGSPETYFILKSAAYNLDLIINLFQIAVRVYVKLSHTEHEAH